jgi:hypothetical protein
MTRAPGPPPLAPVSSKLTKQILRCSDSQKGTIVLTTTAAYRTIAKDLTRSLSNTAKQPQIARETEYYLANIGNIKSVDDFMKNDRIYRYAMKAFGLQDMAYAKAFVRKALTEGIDSQDAFANRLVDPRYRELVTAFNFERNGDQTTTSPQTKQGTVDRFVRQSLEESAGAQNEGVRLALYFERKAAAITNPMQLLGDPALLKVVQTALGLPQAMSLQNIDRQAKMISDRMNIKDLADPKKLQAFLTRFTSLWELQNPSTSAVTPNIQIGQQSTTGLSSSLLAALQNLRLGGR